MLGKPDPTDLSAAALIGTSALLGEYAIIGFGAVFGALILISRSDTTRKIDAAQLLLRAFALSMLLSLPIAIYLQHYAMQYGVPLNALLAPVSGMVALFSDDILSFKDQFVVAVKGWIIGKLRVDKDGHHD